MYSSNLVIPSSALVLLLVFSASPVAFASHSTPFKCSFTTETFTFTSPTTVSFSGSGICSHLGISTVSGTGTDSNCTPTSCSEANSATITAADGSTLSASVIGTRTFTSPTTSTLSGTYTVTGGTGHLAAATGSGTISDSAVVTSATGGTVSTTLSGIITE